MSTFYATFAKLEHARASARELLSGGLNADAISVIAHTDLHANGVMRETSGRASDATVYVGRADDPRRDGLVDKGDFFTRYTTIEESPIGGGISTADRTLDVDSVDQMDDSQEQSDRMTFYRDDVSQSEHESDDVNMSLLTNFPTSIPLIDDITDSVGELQEQGEDGFDALEVPGFGVVLGGGALATAALEYLNPNRMDDTSPLLIHLRDEGVPKQRAKEISDAFAAGRAVLAVEVVPGETNEGSVEEIVTRNGGTDGELVDAPRFYPNGAKSPKSGGGNS